MALPALAFLVLLQQPDLTFVRHGETVANATGKYNTRTLNTLSEKGEREVAALTQTLLAGRPYDQIFVSPALRDMLTIAPYLRKVHQRAVIWPLLYECCTGRRPKNAHPTSFGYEGHIAIPKDLQPLFILVAGQDRYPVAPKYDQGLAQVLAAVEEFHKRPFRGRILLVGHSGMGGHFIHEMTGKWIKLDNAKLTPIPAR